MESKEIIEDQLVSIISKDYLDVFSEYLILLGLSNCLALADIQLLYLFLIRCDRPYFYFSIDVVLLRFCVTSNSFLSPFTFFVTLQILRFANFGKDTSGTRLSTCNNHLRRVQKLFCHLVFLAPQLRFSI